MTLIKFKNNNDVNGFPAFPDFFDRFFHDFISRDLHSRDVFQSLPAVNISETSDYYLLELTAPGMSKEDFKLEIENRKLVIRAELKEDKKDVNKNYTRREFSYSSFSRSFNLPDAVSADAISAEYKDGILKIILPKNDEAKKKPVKEIAVS